MKNTHLSPFEAINAKVSGDNPEIISVNSM